MQNEYKENKNVPSQLFYSIQFFAPYYGHIGILHNDGNALNLMLNDRDELRIIDFGLAKKIDKKLRKKWNDHPNIEVTMHMLIKGLRKYKINI